MSGEGVSTQNVWVLRVSIHCEGCKKKIQKILSKVHGVSNVVIDAPQKRVTVTGNVDGDTLVQRLAKSNKYAVLLPESKPAATSNAATATDHLKNETKPKGTQEAAPEEKPAKADKSADAGSATAAAPAPETAKTKEKKEKKSEKKPQSDDKKTAPDGAAPASAKADGKAEEKKAPKDGEGAAAAAMSRDVGDMYPYPVDHLVHQPQPVYAAMSYNVAHPSTSHAYYAPPMATATQGHTYYAPSMPTATQGYAYYPQYYASPPPEFYYSPADGGSSWSSSQQATDTYDNLFSEENPNGCVVM